MGINGQQWESMGNNGQQWAAMGSNGQQWSAMGNKGQIYWAIGNYSHNVENYPKIMDNKRLTCLQNNLEHHYILKNKCHLSFRSDLNH